MTGFDAATWIRSRGRKVVKKYNRSLSLVLATKKGDFKWPRQTNGQVGRSSRGRILRVYSFTTKLRRGSRYTRRRWRWWWIVAVQEENYYNRRRLHTWWICNCVHEKRQFIFKFEFLHKGATEGQRPEKVEPNSHNNTWKFNWTRRPFKLDYETRFRNATVLIDWWTVGAALGDLKEVELRSCLLTWSKGIWELVIRRGWTAMNDKRRRLTVNRLYHGDKL